MIISDILSYPFLLRALIVGFLVSVSSSLLGVSLVLRRFSMIGDGLSHVGFGALGIAAVLYISPMALTIPVVIAAAFLLLRLSGRSMAKPNRGRLWLALLDVMFASSSIEPSG